MVHPLAHTLDEVLAAVERGETKAGTARVLGCGRKRVYEYERRWASVAEAFKHKRVELVDLAEGVLRRRLEADDLVAATFTLRTLGKDEGYTERQEVTGRDGGPLELQVVERVVTRRVVDDGPAPGAGEVPGQ